MKKNITILFLLWKINIITNLKMFRKDYWFTLNFIYLFYKNLNFYKNFLKLQNINKYYYTTKLTKAEEKLLENRELIIKNEKEILKNVSLAILNIIKKEYLLLNKNRKENEEIKIVTKKVAMEKIIKYLKRTNNLFKIIIILQNKFFILFGVPDTHINFWKNYDKIALKFLYYFIWYDLITNINDELEKYTVFSYIYKYEFESLILNEFFKYIIKLKLYKIDKVIHFI